MRDLPSATRRVLIVEDDADLLEGMSEILVSEGYSVITARDGAEGLIQLRTTAPDLVLLDFCMPRFGGEEFLSVYRGGFLDPGIPVVLMSAGRPCGAAVNAADYFLEKPMDLSHLCSVVRKFTEMNRERRTK